MRAGFGLERLVLKGCDRPYHGGRSKHWCQAAWPHERHFGQGIPHAIQNHGHARTEFEVGHAWLLPR
jgi:hypothetical protein